MSDPFDLLIKCSKAFKTSIENIVIGAKSCETNVPLEEQILKLKQLNNFLESKKLATHSKFLEKNQEKINLDVNEMKKELLEKIINIKLQDKLCYTTCFSTKLNEFLNNAYPENSETNLYKEKIMNQFKIMNANNKEIKMLVEKQKKILEEKLHLQNELRETQEEYRKKLTEDRSKFMDEKNKSLNPNYQIELDKLEKRIKKLNFMRILISRLLIFSRIDWSDFEDFIPIMENMRQSFTIEYFKQNI